MSKMVQVRGVPDKWHKELVRRAKVRGVSLSDYVKKMLEEDLSHMMIEEWVERVKSRPPWPKINGAKVIREVRKERDEEIQRRVRDAYKRRQANEVIS